MIAALGVGKGRELIELPKRSPDTVPALTDGPLSLVTMPWRLVPSQDTLVVIAKLTISIQLDGSTQVSGEPLPASGDELFEPDDERSSLRYPGDFEPFKPKADVLLVGHAYRAPDARVCRAGFGFRRVRYMLAATGDRRWGVNGPSAPESFERVPLRWEWAFGGPGHATNPVGRGYAEGAAGIRLPNLERETHLIRTRADRPMPICFGPVSRGWRQRTTGQGTYNRRWLAERWPYYPEDFDWSTCNAAPLEQQLDYPLGNEEFEFYGLHPNAEVIAGHLPGACPRVLAQYGEQGQYRQSEITLNLDTVWFDADSLTAALVWRGHLSVSAEGAPEVGAIFGCVDSVDRPASLSEIRSRLTRRMEVAEAVAAEPVEEPAPMSRALGFGQSLFGALAPRPHLESPPSSRLLSETSLPSLPHAGAESSRATMNGLILSGESLEGRDFTDCDLSGLDLSGRELRGAILNGANLEGATLDGAHLEGATLTGVRADRASLRGTNLREANLAGGRFREACFIGSELVGANCDDLDANQAIFDGAVASFASFAGARLRGARFHNARLHGASLEGAALTNASLVEADLSDAKLYETNARAAVFDRSNLKGVRADEATLSECSFVDVRADGASFQSAMLMQTDFSGAILDDAVMMHISSKLSKFTRCVGRRARFDGAELSGASFSRANLLQAIFTGAALTATNFEGANLYQAELWKTCREHARFDGAFLKGTKLA